VRSDAIYQASSLGSKQDTDNTHRLYSCLLGGLSSLDIVNQHQWTGEILGECQSLGLTRAQENPQHGDGSQILHLPLDDERGLGDLVLARPTLASNDDLLPNSRSDVDLSEQFLE